MRGRSPSADACAVIADIDGAAAGDAACQAAANSASLGVGADGISKLVLNGVTVSLARRVSPMTASARWALRPG